MVCEARNHCERRIDRRRLRLARHVVQHRVRCRRSSLVLARAPDARRHAQRRHTRERRQRRDRQRLHLRRHPGRCALFRKRQRLLHPAPDVVQQLERQRRARHAQHGSALQRRALHRHVLHRRSLTQHITQCVQHKRSIVRVCRCCKHLQLQRRAQLLTHVQLGVQRRADLHRATGIRDHRVRRARHRRHIQGLR